jgi:hypothetical protein
MKNYLNDFPKKVINEVDDFSHSSLMSFIRQVSRPPSPFFNQILSQ